MSHFQQKPVLVSVKFGAGSDIDNILGELANELARRGRKTAGMIQTRGEAKPNCSCREMHLVNLSTGTKHLISEARGPEARGCHLDWQALTDLAQSLEDYISGDTDVVIINRFGRSESEGRGFRGAIEKAIMLGVQVIVAYRDEYAREWTDFHEGLATECPPKFANLVALMEPVTQPDYRPVGADADFRQSPEV